jgi:2,5-diamino-6-(ribosylamino)-4(3H)-pyrimidinone 5'-phosphate reductase
MAMTADGKIDTVARRGARISGPADTARVDRLRADSDAIMVGGRTLLSEDPRLTVRDPELIVERTEAGRPAQPMKVGVVSSLTVADAGRLVERGAFLHDGDGRVVVFVSGPADGQGVRALESEGAEVYATAAARVDLERAMAELSRVGVERLMVEGGSTLVAALLEAGLVDELQLAVAPLLFGGDAAPTPVGGKGWDREAAIDLELIESTTSADGDVVSRYRVRPGARS